MSDELRSHGRESSVERPSLVDLAGSCTGLFPAKILDDLDSKWAAREQRGSYSK